MNYLVLGLFVSISTLTALFPANVQAKGNPLEGSKNHKASEQRTHAQNKTVALAKLMGNYRSANKANKKQLLNKLVEQTKARQAVLAELVKHDPAAAIRAALPKQVRAGMPAEVQALLETKQELSGKLEVVYEDYEDPSRSKLRHVLITNEGPVALQLPNHEASHSLQSGATVQARGWLFKHNDSVDSLAISDEQNGLTVMALDGSDTTASAAPQSLANTIGEQRTLVLLINFQDNSAEQPWTLSEVNSMVFGTVSDYYREASYGQTWLTGDVHGYLTLPINQTCDFGTMDSYAQLAANDAGIDVASYKRLVYLFPKNSACGWRGQGTVGGTPSRSWINGELNLMTIGHEMGHNFGLNHAKYIGCNGESISDSCTTLEYGDSLDIMGKSTGHFNAFNKERLGWLNAASGQIVTAETDGSYLLEPYESAHGGTAKGLKVRRGTDAATGEALWYHLEYRQALGFDSFLAGKSVTNGVLFHVNIGSDINSSQLMDITPNSSFFDLDDASLVAGSSYVDADAGVTITTEWADATGVSVNVSYSAQSCTKANPSLSLSPNESAWIAPGTSVSYIATVTNNDSSDCANSTFNVSANVPAGWTTSSKNLSLAPGATGSVTINVASSTTTSDGFYDIEISALNSNDSSYNNSGVVSYVVDTPAPVCVVATPLWSLSNAQSGAVTPGSTVTYNATITNQNSDSCAVTTFDIAANIPTGWTASESSVSLASGSSATVNLNVTSSMTANDGTYSFAINAINSADTNLSNSAMATYTVSTPPPACVSANPFIALAGPSGSVNAGTTVNYNVTITSLDSEACDTANFSVNADTPAGWSASSTSVNLAPGATKTVTLSVTSSSSATEGTYNITINAENSANSSYSNSGMVSYAITAPVQANSAPVAVTDNVTLAAKEPILIDVLGNDWDPENDTLNISAVSQGAKGNVQISSDGRLLYTPAKSFKSSDSFSYTITDGNKTATATVKLSLVTSGGSTGGGKGKKNR